MSTSDKTPLNADKPGIKLPIYATAFKNFVTLINT